MYNFISGRVITRQEWKGGDAEQSDETLPQPASHVVLQQTLTDPCSTEEDCRNFMRDSPDVWSNFYIGGDGNAYEGTGWDLMVGTINVDVSNTSVTVTFIGTYVSVLPSDDQVLAFRQLLIQGVSTGKISDDYQLLADPQYPQFSLLQMLNTTQEVPSEYKYNITNDEYKYNITSD